MAEIVELDWSGTVDIDFSTGLGLPDGAVFNPATSLLRVGGGFSAQQFDVYGAGPTWHSSGCAAPTAARSRRQ